MSGITFQRLVHADWSKNAKGRWYAVAKRTSGGWEASGPFSAGDVTRFVELLTDKVAASTLAGFDFPIGVPKNFGDRTGYAGFKEALQQFGRDDWPDFYNVAERPEQISLRRPFYPNAPGGASHEHLTRAHGANSIASLLRECEKCSLHATAAGCMFWTLGGKQVGKAALHGWLNIIRPLVDDGAGLWPFDEDLGSLAEHRELVLCETYPADVYGYLGVTFSRQSKRNPDHRKDKAAALLGWASQARVSLTSDLQTAVTAGFRKPEGADDGFDALVGLLGMIGVADGYRPVGAPDDPAVRQWEGWILGRRS